jgi:hypothetical protein
MTAIFRTIEGALWLREVPSALPRLLFPIMPGLSRSFVFADPADRSALAEIVHRTYELQDRGSRCAFYQEIV